MQVSTPLSHSLSHFHPHLDGELRQRGESWAVNWRMSKPHAKFDTLPKQRFSELSAPQKPEEFVSKPDEGDEDIIESSSSNHMASQESQRYS